MWQWVILGVMAVLLLVLWCLLAMAAKAEEAMEREAKGLMKREDNHAT